MMRYWVLIALLLIAGCSGGSRGEQGDLNYIRGTKGLEISFLDSVPPSIVYQDDKLRVGLSIKNSGTYTMPPAYGKVVLGGYDKSVIKNFRVTRGPGSNFISDGTFISGFGGGDLVGRSLYNDFGDEVIYEFESDVLSQLPTPRYRFTMVAYACYEYQTKAIANICLDPAPHRTNVDKPCITQSVSLGSQGAPVAVSSVDVDSLGPDKARLVFNLQNVGGGDVVSRLIWQSSCPNMLNPGDLGVVDVHVISSSGQPIACNGNYGGQQVRLGPSGTGKVVCTVNIDTQAVSSYMSAFEVIVDYAYRDYVKRDIEIHATRQTY